MSGVNSKANAKRIDSLFASLSNANVGGPDPSQTRMAFWVPGRIEVLGKHTDYGGGRSLLCATERGICMVASSRTDATVTVTDARSQETTHFELSAEAEPRPGHWANYPITVARRIAMNFPGELRGADIVFESDLPAAAGVSSSSALVVAVFLALSGVNDLPSHPHYRNNIHSREDLAGYLGCVENGLDFKSLRGNVGVGTFGGSEDHTAILCSRPDALVQYSFCPVTFEREIAIPRNLTFVVAASGVLAEKTGPALELYNRVSRRLAVGLECWNATTCRADASMRDALLSAPDARARLRHALAAASALDYSAESLTRRFEQFDAEANEIIPTAGDALARADLDGFAELVTQSQLGAERGLENQIAETVALVQLARSAGALAASAFGAGFGGSVWALVEFTSAEDFQNAWATRYREAFPQHVGTSDFFATRAGPAAMQL